MVLPPLELFSLREELPCCRAALSVSSAHFCPYPLPRSPPLPTPSTRFRTPRKASEFNGSTPSRTGSPAPHLGQTGNSNSGASVLDSSTISLGIGLEAISRASSSRSAGTRILGNPWSNCAKGEYEPCRPSIQHSIPACFRVNASCMASSPVSHSHNTVFHVYSRARSESSPVSMSSGTSRGLIFDQSQARRPHAQSMGRTFFAHCPERVVHQDRVF